jgi:hypothetical protein
VKNEKILGSLAGTNDPKSLIVKGYQRYEYIPIDFIKCQIINFNPELLIQNPLLDFRSKFNVLTSEINTKKVAWHKGIKITIADSGFIEFSGSIHKYLNEGIHNYDDFTYLGYKITLNRIYVDFGIRPENMWIQNLEYGVNIIPPIKSQLILNNCFLHKRQTISKPINNKNGHFLQAEHKGNYYIKIYDKAKQYRPISNELIGKEILRIEVKQIRWHKYRKNRIYTLDDFNCCDKTLFINDLILKWDEIVFFNPSSNHSNFSKRYSNLNFWIGLLDKNTKTYYRHLLNLRKENSVNDNDIQEVIKCLILDKINSLNLK